MLTSASALHIGVANDGQDLGSPECQDGFRDKLCSIAVCESCLYRPMLLTSLRDTGWKPKSSWIKLQLCYQGIDRICMFSFFFDNNCWTDNETKSL